MLLLLLVAQAFAADPPLTADVCAAHRNLEAKKEYWAHMLSRLDAQRQQKMPGIEVGITKARADRDQELAEAERQLKDVLGSLQSSTGERFDLRRCATQESLANWQELPNKDESELGGYGHPQFVSPFEARKAACELHAHLETSRKDSLDGLPKALQEKLGEAQRLQTKMLSDMQAGYLKRYGAKLDLATCATPPEVIAKAPPVIAPAPGPPKPPMVPPAPAPKQPPAPLDPWRLSLDPLDLQGLDRQRDVFAPSPEGTRDCGKRLRATQRYREVHYSDDSYHQLCRLKTGRADTIGFRFRIKRDPGLYGKGAYRDDFACEVFQELSACWKGLSWERIPIAPPCKPLVYDPNEPRYQGPTTYKAGHRLLKAWMDFAGVFEEKKRRAARGIP